MNNNKKDTSHLAKILTVQRISRRTGVSPSPRPEGNISFLLYWCCDSSLRIACLCFTAPVLTKQLDGVVDPHPDILTIVLTWFILNTLSEEHKALKRRVNMSLRVIHKRYPVYVFLIVVGILFTIGFRVMDDVYIGCILSGEVVDEQCGAVTH